MNHEGDCTNMTKMKTFDRNYTIHEADLNKFDFTARELMRTALGRGWTIEYSEAMPDNSISGIAHCRKDGREIVFRTDHTILTPIYAYAASENKNLSTALFEKNCIPMPHSVTIPTIIDNTELQAILCDFDAVVVKPLNTNHGKGITIGVRGLKSVREAIEFAKKSTSSKKYVLLQEQIIGAKEYRFLVLNNKVIAVAYRRPPFVVGDGERTIRELVDELNSDPRRDIGHKGVLTKIQLIDIVKTNGEKFLEKIPKTGSHIDVLKTSNLSRGGIAEDFTNVASDALKRTAILAAKSCFLGLAGVDIMTRDIENGDESNSYVIEANSAPGLRMHESPSIGEAQHVVGMIFDELEKRALPTIVDA